ncbi:MAG: hypothetical protein WAV47_02915 [Blastocatellia bacterium]
MFRGFWLAALFLLLSAPGVTAQANRPGASSTETKQSGKIPADDQDASHLPEDMRIKMAIKRAEVEYKKVIENVEKLADLAGEIARGYSEHNQLSAENVKKLHTIEKLAKQVLNHAGGDEVENKTAPPGNMPLADAIDKLNTTAGNIRKAMKTETRYVVSATVIADSNEIITLVRFIRHNQKAD